MAQRSNAEVIDAIEVDENAYETDGISLFPLINGSKNKIQERVFVHYTPRWGKWGPYHNRWVMNGDYKLYQDGRFYNTRIDPLEKDSLVELSNKEMEIRDRFQKLLDEKEADIPFEMNNHSFDLSQED